MATILITGANRGLGLEFVRQYAQSDENWTILATSRSPSPELEALAAEHSTIELYTLDVGSDESVAALKAELGDRPIDVLLNNAGIFGSVPFTDGGVEHQAFGQTDFDNWANVFNVNVFGPVRMAEMFIDNVAASEQKKVVSLSSMLGSNGLNTVGGIYAYRSSKAAIANVMKSMGIDLGRHGILAVAMHPGWAKTDMGGENAEIEADEGVRGVIEQIASLTPEKCGGLLAYDGTTLPY